MSKAHESLGYRVPTEVSEFKGQEKKKLSNIENNTNLMIFSNKNNNSDFT